jgi:hypothetical protein
MKKIIAFFVRIWVFLFGKKATPIAPTLQKLMDEHADVKNKFTHMMKPSHNNRKQTRGRRIQVVPISGRVIFHTK